MVFVECARTIRSDVMSCAYSAAEDTMLRVGRLWKLEWQLSKSVVSQRRPAITWMRSPRMFDCLTHRCDDLFNVIPDT
jgi:hypothetical protein